MKTMSLDMAKNSGLVGSFNKQRNGNSYNF